MPVRETRFTIRSLFVATAVVAVLAAIGGAYARQLSPGAQQRVLIFWLLWLAGSIGWAAVQYRRRYQAEQRAGSTYVRSRVGVLPIVAQGIGGMAMMIGMMTLATSMIVSDLPPATAAQFAFRWLFPLGLTLVTSHQLLASTIWQQDIQFCQHGILWNLDLLPWEYVSRFEFVSYDPRLLIIEAVDSPPKNSWFRGHVAQRECEAIEKVRTKFAGSSTANIDSTERTNVSAIPISELFTTPAYRRSMLLLLISFAAGFTLIMLAIVLSRGSEFNYGASFSLVLCISLATAPYLWRGRCGGPTLVRLLARREALGFFLFILGTVAIYFVATYLPPSLDNLGYVLGGLYCYGALRTGMYFGQTQLDLRAEGVQLKGVYYWPWDAVQLKAWEPNGSGRLVLKNGRRAIISTVPASRRVAVDRLIMEKLYAKPRS